jgi:hypothetical protein
MTATNFWVHEQTRKALSALSNAQGQVRRARSIPELIHAMHAFHIDHLVRSLATVRAEESRVRMAAEERAHALVTELLAECASSDDRDLVTAPLGLHETYRLCCGNFPREALTLRRFMAAHGAKAGGRPAEPPAGASSG